MRYMARHKVQELKSESLFALYTHMWILLLKCDKTSTNMDRTTYQTGPQPCTDMDRRLSNIYTVRVPTRTAAHNDAAHMHHSAPPTLVQHRTAVSALHGLHTGCADTDRKIAPALAAAHSRTYYKCRMRLWDRRVMQQRATIENTGRADGLLLKTYSPNIMFSCVLPVYKLPRCCTVLLCSNK